MHAQAAGAGRAIGLSDSICPVDRFAEVGLHRAVVAFLERAAGIVDRLHDHPQLMPEDPRIFEKRLPSTIGMDVCAAKAYVPDTHQRLPLFQISGLRCWAFKKLEFPGLLKADYSHIK
jgi:hypothetical protein